VATANDSFSADERQALIQHRHWLLWRDLPSNLGVLVLLAIAVLLQGRRLLTGLDRPEIWWLSVGLAMAVVVGFFWRQVNRLLLLNEALRTGQTSLVAGLVAIGRRRERDWVRVGKHRFRLSAGQVAMLHDGQSADLTLAGRTGHVLRIDGVQAIDLPGMPRPLLPPGMASSPSVWQRLWQEWGVTALIVVGLLGAWRLGFVPSLGGETAYVPAEQTEAMDFRRPRIDGQGEVQLSHLRGQVVLLNFWATWCPPCRMEIPDLAAVHQRYQAQGFQVIGVAIDREGPEVVRTFAREHQIPYPLVMGDDGLIAGYGGIRAVPTSFLIDRQGRLAKKYVGLLTGPRLERDVTALLQRSGT
jgi:cytochrome c biogenesis protein CcmG/thiol:disulfide interchange protein DsbE